MNKSCSQRPFLVYAYLAFANQKCNLAVQKAQIVICVTTEMCTCFGIYSTFLKRPKNSVIRHPAILYVPSGAVLWYANTLLIAYS